MKRIVSLIKRALIRRTCEKGIGFIDVLIAIAILGLLSVVYLGGTSVALRIIADGKINSISQGLAEQKMEQIKSPITTIYDSTAPIDYQQTTDLSCSILNGFDADYTDYSYNVTVSQAYVKIQKITINIKQNNNPTPIITLADFKVDR